LPQAQQSQFLCPAPTHHIHTFCHHTLLHIHTHTHCPFTPTHYPLPATCSIVGQPPMHSTAPFPPSSPLTHPAGARRPPPQPPTAACFTRRHAAMPGQDPGRLARHARQDGRWLAGWFWARSTATATWAALSWAGGWAYLSRLVFGDLLSLRCRAAGQATTAANRH